MPSIFWKTDGNLDRKTLKKKRWLPIPALSNDFRDWQSLAQSDIEANKQLAGSERALAEKHPQPHNSINRESGTTGEGMFVPYTQSQYWFAPAIQLDLYAVIDETRISVEELIAALNFMGRTGYGRDASIGLGKFTTECDTTFTGFVPIASANAWLTLAPCAPQGLGFNAAASFYQPMTRFGRHGDAAVLSDSPFKRPLLLAKTGSVFAPGNDKLDAAYIGQGLANISTSQPQAVAQGYAPTIGIRMEMAHA